MGETTNQYRQETLDTVSVVPIEAVLTCAAMALATIAVPTGQTDAAYLGDAMLLGFAGFLLFLISKVSLLSAGRIATWGPGPMKKGYKAAYLLGYLLMGTGSAGMLQTIL